MFSYTLFFFFSLKYSNLKIAKHVAGFSNKRMNVIVGRVSKYSYMLVLKLSTDIDIKKKKEWIYKNIERKTYLSTACLLHNQAFQKSRDKVS